MPQAILDEYAGRPFSFYPPILNIEHNEWVFERGTWSEVLVRNTVTGQQVWIPRRFIGEISKIDEPVMIVGLTQELEYKAGAVWPHTRRVIPLPVVTRPATPRPVAPAPPPIVRFDSATESKVSRLIVAALAAAVVVTALVVALFREHRSGERIAFKPVLQMNLDLTAQDDYHSIVRKLGPPARDRWRSEEGERQFRALDYPNLGVTLILMGTDRQQAFYIGAKDRDWRTVHSVTLPGGVSSDAILRQLQRF